MDSGKVMHSSIPKLKISEVIRQYEPTHVLGTTYTLSLAFFESSIWPCINTSKLSNFLIISDRFGLNRTFQEAPALKYAGREYIVTSAPTSRTFHPKVWIFVEETRALVLVGSGNLTQAGFMENLELFEAIEISIEKKSSNIFKEDIESFLNGLKKMWQEDATYNSLPSVKALDQVIQQFKKIPAEASTSTSDSKRFFHSFQGKFSELLPKLRSEQTLKIVSPYFGGSLQGAQLLKQSLNAQSMEIFPAIHNDGGIDLRPDQLKKAKGINFLRLKTDSHRFSHLKIISALGSKSDDWIFSGSVNCTEAAISSQNIEAGIFRVMNGSTLAAYFEKDEQEVPKKFTDQTQYDFVETHKDIRFSAIYKDRKSVV